MVNFKKELLFYYDRDLRVLQPCVNMCKCVMLPTVLSSGCNCSWCSCFCCWCWYKSCYGNGNVVVVVDNKSSWKNAKLCSNVRVDSLRTSISTNDVSVIDGSDGFRPTCDPPLHFHSNMTMVGVFLFFLLPFLAEAKPPNVLFIMADDLGFNDLDWKDTT